MTRWAAALALAGLAAVAHGQEAAPSAEPRSLRDDASFEGMWVAADRAAQSSTDDNAERLMQALQRARVERNVSGITVAALAQVLRGMERLQAGERDRAEAEFTTAIELDPRLPDGYLGRAKVRLRSGPLGMLGAARDLMLGLTAPLGRECGQVRGQVLGLAALVIAGFMTLVVFSLCMVLRYGALLRHDIEERLGSESRRPLALAVYGTILVLPALAQLGYAWLPFWWLALLFLHLRAVEKAVTILALMALVAVGPLWWVAQNQLDAFVNPLFRAALAGVEGAGDAGAIRELERARREDPGDRDLAYLLAGQLRKEGRVSEASGVYEELLRLDPQDGVAHNNLGNLQAAAAVPASYATAISHYQDGLKGGATESGALTSARSTRVRATLAYNLYLAYLQVFDFQRAQDARNQADQADRGLIQDYERRWQVETDGSTMYAFVDLGPTLDQCLAKFAGARVGVHVRDVLRTGDSGTDLPGLARSLFNRFVAAVGVFAAFVFVRGLVRGKKAFTLRCLKCGTPFCRRCHLGAAVAGLCTQCYHLFVVRDGVSGPARNQKLLEVQAEDERRERVFRMLSLVSPGAGHIYGQRTLTGLVYSCLWYCLLALSVLSMGLMSPSEAARSLVGPWPFALVLLGLLVLYFLANRARMTFEVVVPVRRRIGRARGR